MIAGPCPARGGGALIVVGASAGGVEALTALVAGLPPRLGACVLVSLHTHAGAAGRLALVLGRATDLPVEVAVDGSPCRQDCVTVVPPGLAATLRPDRTFALAPAPAGDGLRLLDALLRSAAAVAGPDAIGVLLSGSLDCGVEGLAAIRDAGGTVVVQDPRDAQVPSMPTAALRRVDVDYVVPAASIGPLLGRLADRAVPRA